MSKGGSRPTNVVVSPNFSQVVGRQRANVVIAGTAAAFLEATQKQFASRFSGVCAVPANHIRDFVPAYVRNPD
jgi:hypothetical protein